MSRKKQELIGTIDSDDEDFNGAMDISKDNDLGIKGKNILKKKQEQLKKRQQKQKEQQQQAKGKKGKQNNNKKDKAKGKKGKKGKAATAEDDEDDSDEEIMSKYYDESDEEFAEEQEDPESLSLVIEENNEEDEDDEESEDESEEEEEEIEDINDDDENEEGENEEENEDNNENDENSSNNNNDDDAEYNSEDDDDDDPRRAMYDDDSELENEEDENENDAENTDENNDKPKKKSKKEEIMTSAKLIRSKLSQHKPLILKSIINDDDNNNTTEDIPSDMIPSISSDNENEEERPEDDEYFEKATTTKEEFIIPFEEMNLSRGMLRSIKSMGFTRPTSIQSAAIGIALNGKDICANASTGSGKTAAFLIPIIERLGRTAGSSSSSARCVILTPTRELAAQCESVFEKLSAHTNLTHVLIVGGVGSTTQIKYLQGGVDVVIATPGRLIDHVLNSPSVTFKNTEILVLDEADQLLDMGFIRQIEEIAKACMSKERRQTLLFSATMTSEIDKLAKLALHKPVWLSVDKKFDMNRELTHELVRLPEGESGNKDSRQLRYSTRLAHLLALCKTQLRTKTLIFCDSKMSAHMVMLYMTLAGFAVTDLHGNLTHVQRMTALHKFREGEVDFLVSTDLAARGLDIEGVRGVINFQLPKSLCRYVHRVGRTARAGKEGRAISLVGHFDGELLRQVVNHSKGKVVKRKVPDVFIQKCIKQVNDTESDVREILRLEADERANNEAMRDVKHAENLIVHREEILANPKKTWFMSRAEKRKLEAEQREEDRKRRKLEKEAQEAQKESKKQKRVKKEIARDQKMQERKKMQAEKELREAYRSAKMAKRESHHAEKAAEGRGVRGAKKSGDKKRTKQQKQQQRGQKRGDDMGVKKPKLHLGKKKSNNQFKSKKRFKRR